MVFNRIKSFTLDVADIYFGKRVTRTAAALAYYLTMTIFPLLICLYSMLGSQYQQAEELLSGIRTLIAQETFSALEDFLGYVSANSSTGMFAAALTVLVTSASAAFRSFQITVGEMQGEIRFRGIGGFLASLVFSVVLLASVYLSILIMLTGSWFLELIDRWLPFINISKSWTWVRFVFLFGLVLLIIYCLYRLTVSPKGRYPVTIGALSSTAALVAVSIVSSMFINESAKYPLVYGSLSAIILLMLWLYTCSMVLIMGAVINIVLRNRSMGIESS